VTAPERPALPSRRERARDATTAEIKDTARALLVTRGPDALTVRAIAREMGLTPPALYRYFGGHEELVTAMCLDVLDEITATLEAARDTVGLEDPMGRLMAICRAFREWSLAHPREYQLTFASMVDKPLVGPGSDQDDGGIAFGAVFLGVFAEIWAPRTSAAGSGSTAPSRSRSSATWASPWPTRNPCSRRCSPRCAGP